MPTTTTIYALQKPTVGGDADVWGGYLNTDIDKLEALLGVITTGGSGAAYTLTSGLSLASYVSGQSFLIKASFTCNAAATLNVDGLGAKNITKRGTVATVSGDVISGNIYRVSYDGTQFQIEGMLGTNFLIASNNLSDLASASTARTNLGLTTAATTAIGTSGATIPLLNANKTDTGSNSFTGALNTFNSGGGNLYVGASANVGGRHGLGVFYDGTDGRIDAVNAGVAFKNIKVDCATFIIQTGDFQGRSAVSVESSGTLTSASSNRIVITTAGVTINDGVHTANDQMLIYNNSASSVTITQDTGMTLRLDGTATTGNRTLGPRGKMHVFFNTNAEAICSGSGVS